MALKSDVKEEISKRVLMFFKVVVYKIYKKTKSEIDKLLYTNLCFNEIMTKKKSRNILQ